MVRFAGMVVEVHDDVLRLVDGLEVVLQRHVPFHFRLPPQDRRVGARLHRAAVDPPAALELPRSLLRHRLERVQLLLSLEVVENAERRGVDRLHPGLVLHGKMLFLVASLGDLEQHLLDLRTCRPGVRMVGELQDVAEQFLRLGPLVVLE